MGRPDHPTKIPVDKIAEEWRSQSSKGRYESAMWWEAGLEEPGASAGSQRRDSAAALTQTGTLMWRRRMLTASTPAASSRATGGRQMALAQRPSRRTPLEGNHRGHRVATRQGGRAARGVRGGSGEIVIEVGGGCRVD